MVIPLVKVHFQRDRSRRAKSLASSSWQKAVPSNDGVNNVNIYRYVHHKLNTSYFRQIYKLAFKQLHEKVPHDSAGALYG